MTGKHTVRYRRKADPIVFGLIALAALILAAGTYFYFHYSEPYAVSADGAKIEEPWVVKIGADEAFVVASEEEGKAVIEGIKESYRQEGAEEVAVSFSPEMTVEKKALSRKDGPLSVTKAEDAVTQVVVSNRTDKPLVTVTTTERVTKSVPIAYKTKYKESGELEQGELKVVSKGKEGERVITSEIVRSNGRLLSENVVSKTVSRKPSERVIEKGTSSPFEDAATASEQITAEVTAENTGSAAASTENAAAVTPSEPVEATSPVNESAPAAAETDKAEKKASAASNERSDTETSEGKTVSSKDATGQDVVDYALKFVGNPYVYGGTSLTNGTDCSGFTMSVYKKFGVSLPRTSSAQRSSGRGVPYSQAKPGDIICYSGHVGIYMGKGKIVHASTPSTGIKVGSATYKQIITVRRIIE